MRSVAQPTLAGRRSWSCRSRPRARRPRPPRPCRGGCSCPAPAAGHRAPAGRSPAGRRPVRPHAELLVDHRPDRAVVAPGLHHHRAAGPAAVDVLVLVAGRVEPGRGQDLRHRAGLLVRAARRRRLGEHRLRVGVGVAALLIRSHAPVVALADRLDGGVEREDLQVALAVGPAAAARVEHAAVVGPRAAVAVALAVGERGGAVVVGRQAGRRRASRWSALPPSAPRRSSASGRAAGCPGPAASRRTRCSACSTTPTRTRRAASRPSLDAHGRSSRRAATRPCRPGRRARGSGTRRCRASPRPSPCARRCPIPRASRHGRRRGGRPRCARCGARTRTCPS